MKTMNLKHTLKAAVFFVALLTSQMLYAQMKPMDGSKMVMSKYDYNKTMASIKQAINENDLMIIHEVDGRAMMKMAGKDTGPMAQLFFFHPKYMRKVLEANGMAGIAVPLKFMIMEKEGKTMVRYMPASQALKAYKGTEAVASELDGIIDKIVGTVKGGM